MQIARNVTDAENGVLRGERYLIPDRDTKYTDEFPAHRYSSSWFRHLSFLYTSPVNFHVFRRGA